MIAVANLQVYKRPELASGYAFSKIRRASEESLCG